MDCWVVEKASTILEKIKVQDVLSSFSYDIHDLIKQIGDRNKAYEQGYQMTPS